MAATIARPSSTFAAVVDGDRGAVGGELEAVPWPMPVVAR
jgi:hypothetical protein